ncbi:MAG: cation diffusion facilitator family transporter [Christensenellaceae bacterium]
MTDFILRIFIKDYKNVSDPAVRASYGKFSGVLGIICNVILFAAKFTVGVLFGSISITADAINNLSDASSSVITLIGFKLSSKPADEKHPYGYSRLEYLSGLIISVIIMAIGVELVKGSIEKIINPVAVEFNVAVAIVLGASIVVKLFLAIFNYSTGKKIKSATLQATGADSRNDVVATSAVLIGCLISQWSGITVDGYIGVGVAVFILWSGIMIAKDTISPLLGEAPDEAMVHGIAKEILANDKVLGIHDLIVHDYGSFRRFASVHIEMDYREDVLAAHEIIDDIERSVKEKLKVELVAHYDPIVTDDKQLNAVAGDVGEILKEIDSRLTYHDLRIVRGNTHSNIIFDLVIPPDMEKKKTEIKQAVENKLSHYEGKHYVVINFDSTAFNDPHAKKGGLEL